MLSHLPCWCVVLQITQVAGEYDLDPENGRTIANINYFYVLDLQLKRRQYRKGTCKRLGLDPASLDPLEG